MIDVEVPYGVSGARIAARWRSSYLDAVTGQDRHGGRWVPESYARTVYEDGPGARSLAHQSADRVANERLAVTRHCRCWTPSTASLGAQRSSSTVQSLRPTPGPRATPAHAAVSVDRHATRGDDSTTPADGRRTDGSTP